MSRRAGHNGRPLLEVPMLLRGLTWLVLFQLLGTGLNVLLLPMLPGPIIGLVLLFGYFLARGEVGKPVNEAAGSLLRYLPLLLVPAAVGVMAYAREIAADFWGHRRRAGTVAGAVVPVRRLDDAEAHRSPATSPGGVLMAWQAALEAVIHHPLFGVGVTLGAYQLALAAYERTRWVFLQPVLVSMLVVIGVLLLCGIDYDEYSASAKVLTILLGPATVALAVPLFLNLRRIRQLFWPTLLTLVVAGTLATVLGIAFGWLFGAEPRMLMSMAPKSVTSPIAMLVASQIGGVAALAAVFVLITGVLGAILGPELLRAIGVRHPAAQGMALGMTAHAVGTSRALQEGEECGAFAALAMSLMGVATAVLLPLAVALVA